MIEAIFPPILVKNVLITIIFEILLFKNYL